MYSLTINRYNLYRNFDTIEELTEAVSSYLSASERESGVLEKLTTFEPKRKDECGLVVNNWRDFRTDCFVG